MFIPDECKKIVLKMLEGNNKIVIPDALQPTNPGGKLRHLQMPQCLLYFYPSNQKYIQTERWNYMRKYEREEHWIC